MLWGVGDLGTVPYTCGCQVRKMGVTDMGGPDDGGVGGLRICWWAGVEGSAGDLEAGSGDGIELDNPRLTPIPPFILKAPTMLLFVGVFGSWADSPACAITSNMETEVLEEGNSK